MPDANTPPASDAPKPDDKAKQTPPPVGLTEEEVQRRIDAALADERRKADEAKQREKEERERAEAEKRGEFEKVAQQEREKREKAEAERDAERLTSRAKDVDLKLRDHLTEHHADYVGAAKWIRSAITFDLKTTDAEIEKSIKSAVEQYVKDNPRKTTGGGAPANLGRGANLDNLPPQQQQTKGPPVLTGAAAFM